MVGAGFSRNAERLSTSAPPFPLLSALASAIYDHLYAPADSKSHRDDLRKVRATFGFGLLRLALEFQAEFGRPALDELIHKSLPDNDYSPGRLHRLLLSLPWSDTAHGAMLGLVWWLARAQRGNLSAPPSDLLATLGNKITTRSRTALVYALAHMGTIVRELPSYVTEDLVAELAVGLDYLMIETKLGESLDPEKGGSTRFSTDEVNPDLRQYPVPVLSPVFRG